MRSHGAERIAGAVYPVAAAGDPMAPFPMAATMAQLHGSSRARVLRCALRFPWFRLSGVQGSSGLVFLG